MENFEREGEGEGERESGAIAVCVIADQEPCVADTLDRSVVISFIVHPLYSEALFTRGFLPF